MIHVGAGPLYIDIYVLILQDRLTGKHMKKFVFVLAFDLLALVSCVDGTTVRILDKAEEIMNEKPDEALVLLDSLSTSEVKSRAAYARLSLLRSIALDKNIVDTSDISIILPALKYYENHGSRLDKARTYFYYGRVLQNGGDDDGALEAMSKAELYAEQTSDLYLRGLIADAIGRTYDGNDEDSAAVKYYNEALECFDSIGSRKNRMYMLEIISCFYMKTGKYEKSVRYAEEALKAAVELNDTTEMISMAVNLSDAYCASGNLGSASDVIRKISDRYCGGTVPHAFDETMCHINLERGNVAEARSYAEAVLESSGRQAGSDVYGLLYEVEASAGNYQKAAGYLLAFMHCLDRENKLRVDESVYAADMRYKNRELTEIVQEKNRRICNILIICSLSVAALIGAVFSVVQARRRKLQEKDSEINEYRNKIIAMQEYCGKLDTMRKSLPGKNALITEQIGIVNELMEVLVRSREEMKASAYAKFKDLTDRGEKGKPAVLEIFLGAFDAKYPGVRTRLNSRYPELTENDIDLYELIGLECSTSVIAYIYNTSESYIYNRRMGLRRKLSLSDDRKAFAAHLSEMCSVS